MAHNKIIIVTIHQPSSKLFQMFHKAILLRQRWPAGLLRHALRTCLRYFAEAEHQHQFGADLGACPSCGTTRPGVYLRRSRNSAARYQRRRHLRGEQSRPARGGAPLFAGILARQIRGLSPHPGRQAGLAATNEPCRLAAAAAKKKRAARFAGTTNGRSCARSCGAPSSASCAITAISSSRSGVAPVLAFLVATILRYSDSGTYDFASAYHIPTFLFLGLIVAMFLGADQQRRRHHRRSRRPAAGAQSQRSACPITCSRRSLRSRYLPSSSACSLS